MRQLNFELKQLCKHNLDGSFATRRDRERILSRIADQLHEPGYKDLKTTSLKPKHVAALCERWKADGLAVGTIKNRMSEIRWWSQKIAKQNVVARNNTDYGIPKRFYVTNVSKARELAPADLAKVADQYSQMSLKLHAAFGLRLGESIKIKPEWADRGDRLVLKDTWTKGSRQREIPIRNDEQRRTLDGAKQLAGSGSLIASGNSYAHQLRRFEYHCIQANIHMVHGHRHHYAQMRYKELTGWAAPAAGGPKSKELSLEQKYADNLARLVISRELGHDREQVLSLYTGR
jgi:site-specific recombinase XerC